MIYKTENDVLDKAKTAEEKSFGEIDKYNRIKNRPNKGKLGQLVEESFFEYKVNSRKGPDFVEAGVELKVTPFKKNKQGSPFSAKERLVLNVIDYDDVVKYKFEDSPFWEKNKVLLIMYYLFEPNKETKDMKIKHSFLYKYPDEDLEIIKRDYNTIIEKVNRGEAHLLSERDTEILSACTKGSKGSNLRTQPESPILAKQRAFSLKQGYMSRILRTYIKGNQISDKIILGESFATKKQLKDYISRKIENYVSMSMKSLKENLKINSNSNQTRQMIISRIFGVKDLSYALDFVTAGFMFKTIKFEKTGSLKESMSFPAFDFIELANEDWEDSQFREIFAENTIVFAVFQENEDGEIIFKGVKIWEMPFELIEKNVYRTWEKTKYIVQSGKIFKEYKKWGDSIKKLNYFPGIKDDEVCHVRNHGKNGKDVALLPVSEATLCEDSYQKMSIWLNSNFIKELTKDLIK